MPNWVWSVFLWGVTSQLGALPQVKLEPLAEKGMASLTEVRVTPDGKHLYAVEQRGRVLLLEGKATPKPFLDIRARVAAGGEMGLLSLAFHPHYAKNQRLFVNYTTREDGLYTIVSEFKGGSPASEKVLLRFQQPYTNHNGGQLAFGKEGFLYIATGDGGSGGDPHGNAQNKDTLLGKILRIDVDQGSPYGIPADNPFARGGGRKEIYAWGLRNPWRFSFDRLTGALFAADVGEVRWEEIDLIERGGNYGWNVWEGSECFKPRRHCDPKGYLPPLHTYGRGDGISVTGGYVYRGKKIPALYGVYLYADYGSGKIWGLNYDQKARKTISNTLLLQTRLPVSSFAEDGDGEILVVSHHGAVFRLVAQ